MAFRWAASLLPGILLDVYIFSSPLLSPRVALRDSSGLFELQTTAGEKGEDAGVSREGQGGRIGPTVTAS